MKSRKYYLAYGSNLNVPQMRGRCPGAKLIGDAEIEDYRLLFKGSKSGSYLTIEKANGYYVPVGIWSVTELDEKKLDIYEGFPNFYYKKNIKLKANIWGEGKQDIEAFVYVMHEDRKLGIPSERYVDVCLDGYKTFGFDGELIEEAVDESFYSTYGRTFLNNNRDIEYEAIGK